MVFSQGKDILQVSVIKGSYRSVGEITGFMLKILCGIYNRDHISRIKCSDHNILMSKCFDLVCLNLAWMSEVMNRIIMLEFQCTENSMHRSFLRTYFVRGWLLYIVVDSIWILFQILIAVIPTFGFESSTWKNVPKYGD